MWRQAAGLLRRIGVDDGHSARQRNLHRAMEATCWSAAQHSSQSSSSAGQAELRSEGHHTDRHVLQWTCHRQLLLVINELGGKDAGAHPRFKAFLQARHRQVSATQIVEDIYGAQSKAGDTANRKYRRLATAAAYALQTDLASTVHHYDAVPVTPVPALARPALDNTLFESRRKTHSMPLHDIVSTSQSPITIPPMLSA